MSIPPWFLAIVVLVIATGVGAYTIGTTHVLPEGFNVPLTSRRIIAPPLDSPIPDKFVMQPYGVHDRFVHPSHVRLGGDPIFNFNPRRMEGFDQNVASNQPPIAYSGIATNENDSPLIRQLQIVQSVAKGTIPTDQNLELISGGSEEPANVPLSGAYQPHQERIYPDQHPRPQHSQLTAGAPTDAGTIAEEIQKNAVRVPSVRELVREEERRESEAFNNPYAVRYQQI